MSIICFWKTSTKILNSANKSNYSFSYYYLTKILIFREKNINFALIKNTIALEYIWNNLIKKYVINARQHHYTRTCYIQQLQPKPMYIPIQDDELRNVKKNTPKNVFNIAPTPTHHDQIVASFLLYTISQICQV